ncbi:MAG: hypothetical protein AABZ47_04345 [Planctomycetota bacterium]
MEMLKRHLFFVICGVAGAGGVALAVTGWQAMPKVMAVMDQTGKLYQDLNALQSKPVNQRTIDAAQKRVDRMLSDRKSVMEKAALLFPHQPLVAGVFPNGDAEKRREFRRAFNGEMRKLLEALQCGRPAVESEVESMKSKIEEEGLRKKGVGESAEGSGDAMPDRTPAGVLTRAGARKEAAARAHLAAAQRIYCYGVKFEEAKPPELEPSLMFDPNMIETGSAEAPELEQCWRAQLRYWIQKDVVDAIVALNEEAATKARERDEPRWVGMMPVKEIISVRLAKNAIYILPSEDEFFGSAPGGYNPATPPACPKTAFTHSASSDFYEVLQFSVKLVMDQRDLLRFVEKLSEKRLYTLLRSAYLAVEPNRDLHGKIYGSDPTVNVVMDFEAIMLGEHYRPMMPQGVCEANNIPCGGSQPKDDKSGKKGGD